MMCILRKILCISFFLCHTTLIIPCDIVISKIDTWFHRFYGGIYANKWYSQPPTLGKFNCNHYLELTLGSFNSHAFYWKVFGLSCETKLGMEGARIHDFGATYYKYNCSF